MIKTKSGNVIQNPLVGTANKAMSDMARYAAELGMTPTARARVTQADAPAKLGKKEIATQEAFDAGDGADWGDDLAPATRLN
jgi:phage terminase small subunit